MQSQCLKVKEKVAFNIASEASYIYILSGQKFIKNYAIKSDLSGNTVFKNAVNWTNVGTFNEYSTQNVNVARFARNVECDFFFDFQTL